MSWNGEWPFYFTEFGSLVYKLSIGTKIVKLE